MAAMTDEEILAEFRAAEALLDGHFILSSGLRSPRYLQCARVLMDPRRAERLARWFGAEIIARRWGGGGRPLAETAGPIHGEVH